MASVLTIEGAPDMGRRHKRCKRVRNPRNGCSQLLCHTGKGRTGWSFMKGSSECSGGGKKRRKRS